MEPLLVFPDPPPPELAQTLDLGGLPVEGRRRTPAIAAQPSPTTAGRARSCAPTTTPRARSPSCRALRKRDVAARAAAAPRLRRAARTTSSSRRPLRRLLPHAVPPAGARGPAAAPVLAHRAAAPGPSSSSTATSCSTSRRTRPRIDGKPLDLTYMEYELLKFLATHPGKVFTRETLLSAGVGLRVLRRRPHGRRPRPAAAGQARRGARQPDPDRALGRLPLRFAALVARRVARARVRRSPGCSGAARRSASSTSSQPSSALQIAPPSITAIGRISSMTTAMTMPPATTR